MPLDGGRSRAGAPSPRTTTASCSGCASARSRTASSRPTARCSPPARRSRSRSRRSSRCPPTASRATSSQNRLDPWHGAWLHPYAFSDLSVDDDASTDDLLVLDVAYRLGRHFAVPVRAEFTCPDSHTIVMTIIDGEGTGSVVETHATPLTAPGRAPRAHGDDRGGRRDVRPVRVPGRPRASRRSSRSAMRASATQLWADDLVATPPGSTSCAAPRRPTGRPGCRGAPAAGTRPEPRPHRHRPHAVPALAPAGEQPVGRHPAGRRGALHQRHRQVAAHASPASSTRGSGVRTPGRERHGLEPDQHAVGRDEPLVVHDVERRRLGVDPVQLGEHPLAKVDLGGALGQRRRRAARRPSRRGPRSTGWRAPSNRSSTETLSSGP